ncbi:MAG: serine hydrolase domain-containing protein [Polyangiaceae bacterium]
MRATSGLLALILAACSPGADRARAASRSSAPDLTAIATETASASSVRAAPTPAPGPRPAAPRAACFDPGSAAGDWLPRGSTVDAGLDGPAVDALIADAMRTQSDSLLVVKDGVVVIERAFSGVKDPIETRSATKSIVALGILALVADGKIASLDVPLSTYYPEFSSGEKARITLRHVLTHTSGLLHGDDADALNAAPDRLAYARRLRVVTTPGTRFSYSNEATQLLSGIIEGAAGEPVETFMQRRLFDPLGVRDFTWARDASGKVQMYYGLAMRARDLARIGLFLLDGGRIGERTLLPVELVGEATAPSATNPYYGLLYWLLYRGTTTRLGYLDPPKGPQTGYFAVGGLGQRVAVYPSARLVAVRQHRRRGREKAYEDLVTWRGMFDRLEAIDPALAPRPRAM